MAYEQARSAVCRSGVTRCGLFTKKFQVTIGGVSRNLGSTGFSIQEQLDISNPNLLNFQTVPGYQVSAGQEVIVGVGHPYNRIFAGHIIDDTLSWQGWETSTEVVTAARAQDYSWLLNLYHFVDAEYVNMGVNTIVADILARFTDPTYGFRPGNLAQGLGNLTISFSSTLVTDALAQIANAASASSPYSCRCIIDYNKYVSIVQSVTDGNALTINDSQALAWGLSYREQATQLGDVVRGLGEGSTTTALVPAGASTIPVADCSVYSPSGGTVFDGLLGINYTGVSVMAGPGSLVGCSGNANDIPQGAQIRLLYVGADATAESTLAGIIGVGSGRAVRLVDDSTLTLSALTALVTNNLNVFKNTLLKIAATVQNDFYKVGKTVTLSITTPKSITGTYVVQSITTTPYKDLIPESDGSVLFQRAIDAVGFQKTFLLTLLGKL